VEEIEKSKRRTKELVVLLAEKVRTEKRLLGQLVEGL
jgi:hypothetical protein